MPFDSSPTLMIGEVLTAWCAASIANLEIVPCGPAGHLALEDQPEAIADALSAWVERTLSAPSPRSVPARAR
jgi:haloalkane dehalogenase